MNTLPPHLQRVVDEKNELDAKREKLGAFKNADFFGTLPWQEQERLNTQAHLMTMYSAVLGERIAALGPQAPSIDTLVNRFLTWPVPADVYPDGTPGQPGRTGTNLLTAEQAKAMLQHVLGG